MTRFTKQNEILYGLELNGSSWIIIIAIAMVSLMATPSSAAFSTFLDLTSWNSAHGEATFLEDFESADIGADADDNGGLEDIDFAGSAGPILFNGFGFDGNGDFNNNGSIDVGDGSAPDGSGNGFVGFRAGINGNVVVDMPFLNFAGGNSPEFVDVSLPAGVTAVSFVYRNGDFTGDGTFLTVDGIAIDGGVGHSGPAFDTNDPRYFDVADSDKIPGASGQTGTGPGFFGIVSDAGPISTLRFTAFDAPATGSGGDGGSTTFNSFDDLRFTEPDNLTVRINTDTGLTEILNDTGTPFEFNSYRIESSTDDLNFSNWNSLSDQNLDAVDGVDPDSIVGNGIGETWDEAGGSDDGVLAESFLQGTSLFGMGRTESLGNSFKPGGDTGSLSFQYRRASDGVVFDGVFEFVTGGGVAGDYDGNGTVDAADYTLWLDNLGANITLLNENPTAGTPGVVDQEDYDFWKSRFGATFGSGAGGADAVPEPASIGLIGLVLLCLLLIRKRN